MTNSLKILLIEDSDVFATCLKAVLEKLQCQAEIAVNGKEALKKVKGQNKANKYDLIFCDRQLPDTNGIDLTGKIIKISRVPIIGMSSHMSEKQQQEWKVAGAAEVYLKDELVLALDTIVGRYNNQLNI